MFLSAVLLSLIAALFASCVVSKMYKIVSYNENQVTNLPDTFRTELPLQIDPFGYFCVQARINQQFDENFIIDTKARTSLYKMDELNQRNANYWGRYPLAISNPSGQKHKHPLYYFDKVEIDSLSFGKPFFWGIDSTNRTYNIMYKNVIGVNILELLNWKFDLDDEKLILFGNKDNDLLAKELEGYIKIEKGMNYEKINLSFPDIESSGKFTLDLGLQAEIFVDKKIFATLEKKYPYRKIAGSKESIYFFSNINVQWGDISIPHCYVFHKPSFPRNIIGAHFIRRFNFILNYRNPETYIRSPENLYIKPRKSFHTIKTAPPISDFGFYIATQGEKIIINLEVGGIAETGGLKLKDTVISIDRGTFNLKEYSFDSELIDYLTDKQSVSIQIEREGQILDFVLTK
jgi:hypothetical protein